ncbi:MAG: SAM-dependent methyltransferase [Verrucomicrobiota bacterium]
MSKVVLPKEEVDGRLRQWLLDEGGSASFEKFFETALYHPEFGYYSKNIRTVGKRGDFSTSASLDPALAKAIAQWIVNTLKAGQPAIRNVIEVGAGDGSLANSVIHSLPWLQRRRMSYHIVDRSLPLREKQKETLQKHGRVRWHESVKDALDDTNGRAVIFSNELVDAFPPRLFQWIAPEGNWNEVSIALGENGNLRETLNKADNPPSADLASSFRDGQRIERHDSYSDWLDSWVKNWTAGEMLTIDYGDDFPTVYHRRPQGTLRGFFHHVRIEAGPEIYTRFGHHDLTADIDFTALTKQHTNAGLKRLADETQAQFITHFAPEKKTPLPAIIEARNAFRCLRFAPTQ